MTDEDRLKRIAIKTFEQHWTTVLRNIEKGKNTYATKLYRCFEADTTARQKILANRFYGIDHARKMATLSDEEIIGNISCYLQNAIQYALSDPIDLMDEPKVFMKKLVRSEYVIFDSQKSGLLPEYNEDVDDLSVAEYPANVTYDDWYERIGGINSCNTVVLMKSTGEDFSKTEVNWLRKSIQHNIDSNEPDALWWFDCDPVAKNKLWIKIFRFEMDKEVYKEGFLSEVETLSKDKLKEFVRQTLEYACSGKKLRVFNNYESMGKKDLLRITENFFSKNWDELGNMTIRTIEDAMNSITGRKDRDYHARIYF